MSFCSSSEPWLIAPARLLPQPRHLPWGFALLRDINRGVHFHSRGRPVSHTDLRSARSVLPALDGLLLLGFSRFVSPASHVRDSLFRGFPRQPACLTFASQCPLDVGAFHLERPKSLRQLRARRLQGVAPTAGPYARVGGLDQPEYRSPLEFSDPRRASFSDLVRAFALPPLSIFSTGSSQSPLRMIPSVCQSLTVVPVPRKLSLSGFSDLPSGAEAPSSEA